jgi:hypothetical protein
MGTLPPGDYRLGATIAGLSSVPLVLPSAPDTETTRDAYLAMKAAREPDFNWYWALQLARVKDNPTKVAAYLQLADRSLEHGSLAETMRYFDGAIAAMDRLIEESAALYPAWAKQERAEWAPRAARIRRLQRELPEYFSHRSEWRITTDPATGNYVIRSRRDHRIIREIRVSNEH